MPAVDSVLGVATFTNVDHWCYSTSSLSGFVRERYPENLAEATAPGGAVIIATLAEDGPEYCSGCGWPVSLAWGWRPVVPHPFIATDIPPRGY